MKNCSQGTLVYSKFLFKRRELHFDFYDQDSKFVVGLHTTPKTLKPHHRPMIF